MHTAKPFLFVQCRPAGSIASDERQTISEVAGLTLGKDLHAHLLLDEPDLDPVRDLNLKDDYSGVILSGSPFKARHRAVTTLGFALAPTTSGVTPHTSDAVTHAPDISDDHDLLHLYARVSSLVTYLLDNDLPTLGLCYGLQMLALASGTPLTDQASEDLQTVEVTLTPEGRSDPVTGQLDATIYAYTGHEDSLAALPEGATLLGVGAHCRYQLVRFSGNIYGTQFHPEITTAGMRIRIDHYGGTYYDVDTREAVIARCMEKDVTSSHQLLSAFVDYYRR